MRVNAHIHTMAYIDRTETKKEIEDVIRGNSVSNLAPTKVPDEVQLVCNVNPKDYRINNIVETSNAGTIYTTPTNKDFFLTAYNLTGSSTTVGNNSTGITFTPFGSTSKFLALLQLVNTVSINGANGTTSLSFSIPIKVARGTTISIGTAAGTIDSARATIFGYTAEA